MPKLYEYFGLTFLFYSDDHDPMHLDVNMAIAKASSCSSSLKASW